MIGQGSRLRPRATRLRAAAALVGFALVAAEAGAANAGQSRSLDSLTAQILERRCVTSISVEEVTLFRNGTLRVRQRLEDRRDMLLAELGPIELSQIENRLGAIDLSEAVSSLDGATGEWVGQCSLLLHRDGEEERFFRYGRLDALGLGLETLDRLVDELARTADERADKDRLPADYEPKPGDLLRRRDGAVFEVIGLTGDERAVEMSGIDQPLTLYVAIEEFRSVFVAVAGDSLLDLDR